MGQSEPLVYLGIDGEHIDGTGTMLTQEHIQTAQEFLDAADREFADGEVLQASEKMWGAATHGVMAVAQQRGWSYGSHRDMKAATQRLAAESDNLPLIAGFSIAEKFHANFYHGFMEEFEFDDDRTLVRDFVVRVLNLTR